jgi:glycosidase
MIKEAIYHKVDSDYSYGINKNEFIIKIRTKKDNIDNVNLIYADKYKNMENKETICVKMNKVATDGIFDYYEKLINIEMICLVYIFELSKGEEKIYYGNYNFFEEIPEENVPFFSKPSMAEKDFFIVPEWAKKAIVYQIFPERFCNGDKTISPKNVMPWYSKVDREIMLGGDLRGIINKLSYLEKLGINTLYLTPVFEAGSNHKYDTFNYFKIDPQFGDLEVLKELVKKAHDKGIRVILDAVFNHSGIDFHPFKDVIEKGEQSEYKDWFQVKSFPIEIKEDPDYATFAYHGYMPKLMTKNPKVKDYLISVATYWIEEADIDGWRLDVADEIDHDFWRAFRKAVKKAKSDELIIGEVWYDSSSWLKGDQFDSVMNYEFQKAVSDFVINEEYTPKQFENKLGFIRGLYMLPAYKTLWNLIDSHDTPRFLYKAGEDKEKLKLAAFLQFTMPGAPMIFYGDEVGMTGEDDPDCRRGMLWDEEKQDKVMFEYYQRLIVLRKEYDALSIGEYITIYTDENLYGYRRKYEKCILDIYVNKGNEPANLTLTEAGKAVVDIFTNEKYEAKDGKIVIDIAPKKGIILKAI